MNFLAQLLRRKQMQDDISEEIRLHLAQKTEELVEAQRSHAARSVDFEEISADVRGRYPA